MRFAVKTGEELHIQFRARAVEPAIGREIVDMFEEVRVGDLRFDGKDEMHGVAFAQKGDRGGRRGSVDHSNWGS